MTSLWIGTGFVAGAVVTLVVVWARVKRSARREAAARRRASAAERGAELASMTRGLAHEICNPLSTIGLNTQLLRESVEDLRTEDDQREPVLRRIETLGREVERLRGILEDFLEFAGELRVENRRTDLSGVVEEIGDFFHPQAESRGVRLRVDLPGAPVYADVDAPHLKQAVLNLLLNAVEAMDHPRASGGSGSGGGGAEPGRGELILRLRDEGGNEKAGGGKGGASDTGRGGVELRVADTGPGIPDDVLARVFEPYFTTKGSGTGLGLATTRRLVEAMGGTLDVHSEPGVGTEFTIVFPPSSPRG